MSIRKAKNILKKVEEHIGFKHNLLRRRINEMIEKDHLDGINQLLFDMNAILKGGGESEKVFSEKDLDSGDGFQTYTWGPMVWGFLHILSFNYRKDGNENRPGKKEYKNFLHALSLVLPCSHCRTNFTTNKKSALVEMTKLENTKYKIGVLADGSPNEDDIYRDRCTFSRFIWELHHQVNIMLNKDVKLEPSFEKVRQDMEIFRSRCLTPEEIEAERKKQEKGEGGCTAAIHGASAKSKCVIKWVPRDDNSNKLNIVKPLYIHPECQVYKKDK